MKNDHFCLHMLHVSIKGSLRKALAIVLGCRTHRNRERGWHIHVKRGCVDHTISPVTYCKDRAIGRQVSIKRSHHVHYPSLLPISKRTRANRREEVKPAVVKGHPQIVPKQFIRRVIHPLLRHRLMSTDIPQRGKPFMGKSVHSRS